MVKFGKGMDKAIIVMGSVVGLVLLSTTFVALLPTIISTLTNLSQTMTNNGLPFASLISPTGIAGILIAISIFVGIFAYLKFGDSGK